MIKCKFPANVDLSTPEGMVTWSYSVESHIKQLDERIARFETGAAYEGVDNRHGSLLESIERRLWYVSGIIEGLDAISDRDQSRIDVEIQNAIHDIQLSRGNQ